MKSVLEFIKTGVGLLLGYTGYALAVIFSVIILGAPFYIGFVILDRLLRGLF